MLPQRIERNIINHWTTREVPKKYNFSMHSYNCPVKDKSGSRSNRFVLKSDTGLRQYPRHLVERIEEG